MKELHDSGVNLINSSSFDYKKKISDQTKNDNLRLLNYNKSKSLKKSSSSVKKNDPMSLFNKENRKSSSIKKDYIEDNHEISNKMFKIFRKSLDDNATYNLKMKQSMLYDAVKKKNT